MESLFALLTDLSIDPFKHAAFVADHQDEALSAGEYAAIVQARSPLAQAAIAGEGWIRCAFVWDPGPDPVEDPDRPEIQRQGARAERLGQHRTARVSYRADLGTGRHARA